MINRLIPVAKLWGAENEILIGWKYSRLILKDPQAQITVEVDMRLVMRCETRKSVQGIIWSVLILCLKHRSRDIISVSFLPDKSVVLGRRVLSRLCKVQQLSSRSDSFTWYEQRDHQCVNRITLIPCMYRGGIFMFLLFGSKMFGLDEQHSVCRTSFCN